MLKREKEFKERPYKRSNELHSNSKKIGFFSRLRQLFVNSTNTDTINTDTINTDTNTNTNIDSTNTNNEISNEINNIPHFNRTSTPSVITTNTHLNELIYLKNNQSNSQIDISNNNNNNSNVSVLSQMAPTEALADFFTKKGDNPLNDVEVEGVLSLLGKSINHQQQIPSFTNNKDFTSTSLIEASNNNTTSTLNSPSVSKSFSSSPKVTKYKQSIPQTTRRRIIHYSSLPSPYRTRISSPLSSYYDSEEAEKDKKLKESLKTNDNNDNNEKFLFDPRKKLQNKIESDIKKSNLSSKKSNNNKPISKTAAALLSLLDNKDQINSINNNTNNSENLKKLSNPYSNLKNNKKISSSSSSSTSSTSSKKSQIKIKKPISKKDKKFISKSVELESNKQITNSSTDLLQDSNKKSKKLVRKSSFNSTTFLSEGRTPHPITDKDYRYEEATSSSTTSAGTEIDNKPIDTVTENPKDTKPFNFNSLVNKDDHKPIFSFTSSSSSSAPLKPVINKQENQTTINNSNEPVLKSILKNPIKENEILSKDTTFTFTPKNSNIKPINSIPNPCSISNSTSTSTSTSTSKPMFSFSSDFNSNIKNNTSTTFSLFGPSSKTIPTTVEVKKDADVKEIVPVIPSVPSVPSLNTVPAIPPVSITTSNGTTETTESTKFGKSDIDSSITFKFEFPIIESASREILDKIDEDKVKKYQNIYQF